ncbi:MAG TPA: hypothetical protein DCE41_34055 [Cytophagales bacterium]|nr:hypothetical protein [Cytophagales bacterium]
MMQWTIGKRGPDDKELGQKLPTKATAQHLLIPPFTTFQPALLSSPLLLTPVFFPGLFIPFHPPKP